jgi:hypothetical protein
MIPIWKLISVNQLRRLGVRNCGLISFLHTMVFRSLEFHYAVVRLNTELSVSCQL